MDPIMNVFYGNLPKFQHTAKEFLQFLLAKSYKTPTCEISWNKQFPELTSDDKELWENIYLLSFKICRDTRSQSFQYKLIHQTRI